MSLPGSVLSERAWVERPRPNIWLRITVLREPRISKLQAQMQPTGLNQRMLNPGSKYRFKLLKVDSTIGRSVLARKIFHFWNPFTPRLDIYHR
jgi:hypothetical protein